MRSRRSKQEAAAEVARRRLELLGAELAGLCPDPPGRPDPGPRDGPGEHTPEALPPPVVAGSRQPGRHARRGVGPAATVAGWVGDRLPASVQGRMQLGASHLTVVAVIVAASLAATCWWVLRADGQTRPVPPLRTAAATASDSPSALVTPAVPAQAASPVAAASPSATIVVDVAGKVRRPGIATLPLGARVVDALEAAGGVRKGVRLGSLNLARVLTDGEQVLVGVPAAAGVAASAAGAPASGAATMVNLNTAGQPQLETLPGVGPVTAQAILEWRTQNGAFTAVDELLEVSGIGEATLARIAPYVTL